MHEFELKYFFLVPDSKLIPTRYFSDSNGRTLYSKVLSFRPYIFYLLFAGIAVHIYKRQITIV